MADYQTVGGTLNSTPSCPSLAENRLAQIASVLVASGACVLLTAGNFIRTEVKMNLCRAAALALVGWYLMLPQMKLQETKDNGWTNVVDKSVPLAQWTLFASFDSAAECKAMQAQLLAPPNLADHQRYVYSSCVASDDPRLKGN